jgi:hypothetical protein
MVKYTYFLYILVYLPLINKKKLNSKTENNNDITFPISKFYSDEKNEKYNTINLEQYSDSDENELNEIKRMVHKIKNIKNKCEDFFNNYLITQKSSNNNHIGSKNNEKETIYKQTNIVYNKPKLQNIFSKTKPQNKERDNKIKISRNKNMSELIEHEIKYYLDNIKNNINKYSSKTTIREREKDNVNKNTTFKKIKNMKGIYRKYNNSGDSKNNRERKKIKEIIINKNLCDNTIVYYNNNNNNNNYILNTKRFIDQRRPIQINLSLQNTVENSQINNNYKINNYCITDIRDSNFNETPTIIIHNKHKQSNLSKNNKKVNNIDKADNIIRTKSENKIKTININFMKNIFNKEQKTKNKNKNDINPEKEKENVFKDKDLIQKYNADQFQILPITKTFKRIDVKKRKNTNINTKKILSDSINGINGETASLKFKKFNNTFIQKRKMSSPYMNNQNKSDISIKNDLSFNSYKKISQSEIGETFKYSIRNKYKKEKSKKL